MLGRRRVEISLAEIPERIVLPSSITWWAKAEWCVVYKAEDQRLERSWRAR